MVLCYKSVLSSPARSKSSSPLRKVSPRRAISNLDLRSSLIRSGRQEFDLMDIPRHDWKILEALARKREEEYLSSELAHQFQNLWEKEQKVRKKLDEECKIEYQNYISRKREREAQELEMRKLVKECEEIGRLKELIDKMKRKEEKSEEILRIMDYLKYTRLRDRNEDMTVRGLLATTTKQKIDSWENYWKRKSVSKTKNRTKAAQRRRNELLCEISERTAINTNLCQLETTLARQELQVLEQHRREGLARRLQRQDSRFRAERRRRDAAKRNRTAMAQFTAQLREQLK